MAQITLTDFSGGKNAGSPERLSQNEASDLRNLIHTDGCLVSLNGRTRLNTTAIAASAVNGLYRWYKSGHRVNNTASTSQKGWLVASCGSDIHLWTGSAFVPLMRTTNVTTRPGFSSANGRCYMARNGLHRFDGFYYNVGTVTVAGGALTTVNADADLGIDWSYVTPGCDIFIKNGSTWEGPYVITSCTSTALTLTSNASVVTGAEYIIRRSNDVGIDAPSSAPTIAESTPTSALDVAADYKYSWTIYRLSDGVENTAVSAYTEINTGVSGGLIRVSVTPRPYNTWWESHASEYGVRIYRTTGGTTTYYKLVDIPYLQTQEYLDSMSDTELSGHTAFTSRTHTILSDGYGTAYSPVSTPDLTLYASATGIAAGSYKYKFTLYNSQTGVESNGSPASATATPDGSQSVTVTAATSDLTLIDRQADYVRFYRTYNGQTGDDALYYRLAQVPWAGGATSVAYVDSSVADVDLGVQLAPEDNNPAPAGVNNCYYHNGKLYLWGTSENPNRLYFSTTGEPEYYPPYEFGVHDDIAMENYTLGGYVDFGDTGNEILGVISDSGPITDSNSIAAPLLVVTRSRLYHWYGSDWRDFRRVEIGHDMTACRDLCNWKGVITRISKAGPTLKPPGNIVWQDAYQKLFPQATLPFSEQVTAGGGTTDYFDLSCATVWRDRLVFTWCQTTSTSPNRMAMLHLPTGTYTEIGATDVPISCYSLSVWDGPGDNGELYYGDNSGVVWRLDAKTSTNTYWTPATTTGVATVYKSGLITIDNKDAYNSKRGIRLTLRYRKPSVDQSITVKFYNDGNSTAQDTVTKTLSSSDAAGRLTLDLGPPSIATKGIQFEITGTFTVPVFLEGWKLEYESSGRNAH